jgi:hypothetical protein
VSDDQGLKLGDLEYTISIEDFGDIESQNASRQSFNNSVIKNNDDVRDKDDDVDFNQGSINNNKNSHSSKRTKNQVEDVKVEESQHKFLKQ